VLDTFIANGTVANCVSAKKINIGIKNGSVVYLGTSVKKAKNTVDAGGNFVFPGVIDPHVHFMLEAYGAKTCDDYYSGSAAGASGGVTTFIDFAIPSSKNSSLKTEVARKVKLANDSVLDFSFHPQILGWNNKIKNDVLFLIKNGFPTFKIFTPATEGWGVSDSEILRAIKFVSSRGGAVEFHAESGKLLNASLNRLILQKKTSPRYFPLSGPDICEAEAVERISKLAKTAGGKIYICHMTSKIGLEKAIEAQKDGVNLKIETAPHYLFLNETVFKKKNGFLFCCNPVLKKSLDNRRLIRALKNNIDWLGTDHCAFSYSAKAKNKNNFLKIPRGLPGIGMSFPLLFTEFKKKNLPLGKLIRLTSASPAKHFGLKNKGEIKIGKDADLFIVDPRKKFKAGFHNSQIYDWSPYSGRELYGFSTLTMRRGAIIYKNGKITAKKGGGKLIFRKL